MQREAQNTLPRLWRIILLVALCVPWPAAAWGPHPAITKAALDVLPEADRAKQLLGAQFAELPNYSWLPDMAGQEGGDFYVDDYLLIRAVPQYIGHGMPSVQQAWEPFFRRALQALRTETPLNAARQLGPLIHFVEDTGAPPHAASIGGPLHGPLENWLPANQIVIAGYKPQLLGADEAAAVAGLRKRLEALVAFSKERADRARPLVEQGAASRPQVEPLILESALETARVLADVLHTLFTLAEAPTPPGATLKGTITAGVFYPGVPAWMNKAARVLLLDNARYEALGPQPASLAPALTDFGTLAYGLEAEPNSRRWHGGFILRQLPPGVYRVWIYRVGSRAVISPPIRLAAGKIADWHFDLPPEEPAGNLVQNPRGDLAVLTNMPERWRRVPDNKGWTSATALLTPGFTYRCGAVLRDPEARIRFIVIKKGTNLQEAHELPSTAVGQPAEIRVAAMDQDWAIAVSIETPKKLHEAIERVWVVPAGRTAQARQ